ncbi:hypothetical protein [Chlorogloeopsis sp. ULAP02]|uniref:hypothetical protein n=1 Tax=Chlorogloeopsis sp. ULAP02 TaxID=3107926 RepID=UPI00398ADB16
MRYLLWLQDYWTTEERSRPAVPPHLTSLKVWTPAISLNELLNAPQDFHFLEILSTAVFFHRLGEVRDRSFEDQCL